MIEAVYLGVYGHGTTLAFPKNIDSFLYRFLVDGKETLYRIDNGPRDENGNYTFPIQNTLKRNRTYDLTISENTIIAAKERMKVVKTGYEPPVKDTHGLRTVKNFIETALMPVGTVLYIYGGGWNWQDTGSSIQVRSVGISDDWVCFFDSQNSDFSYKGKCGSDGNENSGNCYYPLSGYNEFFYAGLDCSGYVNWAINNTLASDETAVDHFSGATKLAYGLSARGLGRWTREVSARGTLPGDIVSINGHVWISLGVCADGSTVILHSTPSDSRTGMPGGGVQIGAIGGSEDCEAYRLADKYMSVYYAKWYERYPAALKSPDRYFSFTGDYSGLFSWDVSGKNGCLTDPDRCRGMTPSELLALVFKEKML